MNDMTTTQRLALACFITLCAFGTISWLGGRTIVKALDSIEENTEFRVAETERQNAIEQRLRRIEASVASIPGMDKNIAIIASKITQWENADK